MKYTFNKIYSDYANVHAICREVLDVSNLENIDSVLIGGSLLGMIRDGDFLPWDKDLDFAVFESEIEKTLGLEMTYRDLGYECRIHRLGVRDLTELNSGQLLISNLQDILANCQIEHCLIGGALLNLYRDNQLYTEIDTIAFLINPSQQTDVSHFIAEIAHLGKVFDVAQTSSVGYKSVTLVTAHWRVNFFIYSEHQGNFGWRDLNCEHWFDQPLFPATQKTFGQNILSCPNNCEAFLSARFGENWQHNPTGKFSHGRVVGSMQLYKDGVMFDFIFHYVRGTKTYWYEPAANVISSIGFIPYSLQHTTAGYMLIPDHAEVFLEEHYGDWKVPVKQWDGAVDNPTIIDPQLAMSQILKHETE